MDSLAIQYERLRRHAEAAANTYDRVSLLDVSHSLRVWADLTKTIPTLAPDFEKSIGFQTAKASHHAQRRLKDREYVYSLLADGVTTYASRGQISGFRGEKSPECVEVIAKVRRNGSRLDVAFYAYISPAHDLKVAELFQGQKNERCTFRVWMNSPVVVGQFRTLEDKLTRFSLTRAELIRRVANEYEASHPSGFNIPPRAIGASNATRYLFDHLVAGLPLPYFHLLKDAQDLVKLGRKYFLKGAT